MRGMIFINLPNPSSHTMLEFTQPLTEMNIICKIKILLGKRVQLVHHADNPNIICEPIA
jgi:hypothetical protein